MKKVMNKLSLFGFFAITLVMVLDVYEYPIFATSGLELIFFLVVGGLLWFVPAALCAAEMATIKGWERGGIYTWVKNTLGKKWGWLAIFCQWFQITVGFVTMLYFIVDGLAEVTSAQTINENPLWKFGLIVIIFWLLSLSQMGGTKKTEVFGKIASVIGIFAPIIILFVLTTIFIVSGGTSQITLSPQDFWPDFSQPATMVVFVSFILSYMGVEASASYVNELKNPQRNYPLAIFLVVLTAILVNAIGGLSVAVAIPSAELSLGSGVSQTLNVFFAHLGLHWEPIVKIVTLMLMMGVIGEIAGWVVGPAKGLLVAAEENLLPSQFKKTNKHGVPIMIVIGQGLLVTMWAAILTFSGGGNNLSFQIAISLTVVIYLIAYLLFFSGFIKLVWKQQKLKRVFEISGGKIVKTLVAGAGLTSSIFALVISFWAPTNLSSSEAHIYMIVLIVGFIATLLLALLIYKFMSKKENHARTLQ
ncbi:MAG: amino acid permease [Pseudomonadales bacterium]|nr:amino acid permease [Pseudomonadales bacterium]